MSTPRIVVFARYPTPGHAKTRLIPALGEAGAAELQDAMTHQTLLAAASSSERGRVGSATLSSSYPNRNVSIEVRFTGCDASAMRNRYGGAFHYEPQGDGDLGARLSRSAAAGYPCVIVGSDCPGVTENTFRAALEVLERCDAVLGPSLDGGYYLIGLRNSVPGVFDGIDWSTERVLAQTIQAMKNAHASYELLESLSDVDVPADLVAYPHLHVPALELKRENRE